MGLSKEPKVGDRFERITAYGIEIFTYLGNNKLYNVTKNHTIQQFHHHETWAFSDDEFVGNFSKDSNITNLYSILNENS